MNDSQKNIAIVVSYVVFLGVIAYSHSLFLKAISDRPAPMTFDEEIDRMHARTVAETERIQEQIDKGNAN